MLLAIEYQSQPSASPAIAIPILVQAPGGLSKKNAPAIPPMTMPAPTLFQNEAAILTRSLRCSVELLSKCSSSRMSILRGSLLTGAEIIAEDRRDSRLSFRRYFLQPVSIHFLSGCSSKFHSEESMRAYQLPKGGAGIDALVKVERPDPKPAYRQVVVKVKACSLNFRDLGIVRGTYRMPVRENLIPLSDGAGEVIEVGPGVTRVKVGDRVAGCFFQRWAGGEAPADVHASALGGGIDGMLAEYAVLEEDGIVKIPAHLSLEEGATLPCAGVTVWSAMMEHAKLVAGQTVLLQGTGGV